MVGLSGAVVEVVDDFSVYKSGGGADLVAQRELCRALGAEVCPTVVGYVVNYDGYYMERLLENTASPRDTIYEIYALLDRKVWRCPPFRMGHYNWLIHLVDWCRDRAPWINRDRIWQMYVETVVSMSLTHGDPTASNAMRNQSGELRLIDPLPCRPYVPPLVEVDVGKLMQSAAGYETLGPALDGPWPWSALGQEFQTKSRFWCAVHCARILPYAPDDATREWAETRSREYAASI